MATRRVVGAGAAFLVLLAAACGGGGAPVKKSSPKPAPIPRGGTLRVVYASGLSGDLDPQDDYTANDFEIFRCCLLRTLLSYTGRPTSQGGAELQPDLAVQLPEVSPDGLTWTFQLKQGIHYAPPFQNEEVVADDFIRAMRRELDRRVTQFPYSSYYDVIQGAAEYESGKATDIAGMEASSPHTLIVHLTEPAGDLGYRFTLPASAPIPFNPLRPNDPFGAAWDLSLPCPGCPVTYGNSLVSTGPYMYEGAPDIDYSQPFFKGTPDHLLRQDPPGFAPGKSLTLVRNPSWDPATDRLRPAYPDRIEITLGHPTDKANADIEAGRFDLSLDVDLPAADIARYRSDPALNGLYFVNTGDFFGYLAMNLAIPPFDDLHVRKAVNWALDRAAILHAFGAGGGTATVTAHVVDNSSENNLLLGYDPYAGAGFSGDLTKARDEMAQSGYDHNHDGQCDDPACSNVLSIGRSDPPFGAIDELIQRNLGQIGIKLHLKKLAPDDFNGAYYLHLGRPALSLTTRFLRDYPDAAGAFFQTLFGTSVTSVANGTNDFSLLGVPARVLQDAGYAVKSVPSVDDRIQSCQSLIGPSRLQCWAGLDQYVMENVAPWAPYMILSVGRAVSSRVINYSFDQFSDRPALDQMALKPGS